MFCCSPMQRDVSTVPIKIYTCCCSPMQRNVLIVRTHGRHTGAATTFQNQLLVGLPAKTTNGNDFYRREYYLLRALPPTWWHQGHLGNLSQSAPHTCRSFQGPRYSVSGCRVSPGRSPGSDFRRGRLMSGSAAWQAGCSAASMGYEAFKGPTCTGSRVLIWIQKAQ